MRIPRTQALLSLAALPTLVALHGAAQQPQFNSPISNPNLIDVPSYFGDRLVVKANIEDVSTLLHLDTGTPTLALSKAVASSLEHSVSASTKSEIDITLGSRYLQVTRYEVIDYDVVEEGRRLGGIIGFPLFQKFSVFIDFKAQRIMALPSDELYGIASDVEARPLIIEGGYPSVHVTFGGVTARMLLDTGSSSTFVFSSIASKVIASRTDLRTTVRMGYGSPVSTLSGIYTQSFLWGQYRIRRPLVLCPQTTPSELSTYDGILGRDIIRNIPIFLDYSRSTILLGP